MKKLILSALLFTIIPTLSAKSPRESLFTLERLETESDSSPSEKSSYILRLRFPSHIKVPTLCGFYKGYRLDFSSDICIIKEAHSCPSFSIVIAEDITTTLDGTTIQSLEQIPSKKCRMFYITKNIKKDGSIEWDVEEESQENIPTVLPKAAIILLFNPDYIDKIDPSTGKNPTQEEVFSLPLIEIKKDISQKELDQTSTASWCASVDIRGIHRATNVTKKKDALRLISLARPLYGQSR